MREGIITGLWGCDCHPFDTWHECDREHNKKLSPGQQVKCRCTGRTGIVRKDTGSKGFYLIQHGRLKSGLELHHAGTLKLMHNDRRI